jgi:transposase
MWVKLTAEKVLDTVMEWETDGEVLLQVAIVMDEERGQQTVLNALEQFLNESNLSWRKKGKEKNPQHYMTPVTTKVLQHHHYQT